MVETHNLLQYEGVEYTHEELAKCRLLTKGLNGLVFTADLFAEMYPEAVFFGLLRGGLPLLEGRIRRGQRAEHFGQEYKAVVSKMLDLQDKMPNYHVVRFEDMVTDPVGFIKRIYECAGADLNEVKKVRLMARPITQKDGQREITMKGGYRQVRWYAVDELKDFIKPNINKNQEKLLKPEDKQQFINIAGEAMERAGYLTN